MEEVNIVRVAMRNGAKLDFRTTNGTKEDALKLYESLIEQWGNTGYSKPPFIRGPSSAIMKTEIVYIGLERINADEEDEFETGEEEE